MTSVASGYNRTNSLYSNPKVDTSAYHALIILGLRTWPTPASGYDLGAIYLKLLVTKENTPALASTGAKATSPSTSNHSQRN